MILGKLIKLFVIKSFVVIELYIYTLTAKLRTIK